MFLLVASLAPVCASRIASCCFSTWEFAIGLTFKLANRFNFLQVNTNKSLKTPISCLITLTIVLKTSSDTLESLLSNLNKNIQ